MTIYSGKSGIGWRIGQLVFRSVFAAVLVAALALSLLHVDRELKQVHASLENTGYVLAAAAADAVVANDKASAFTALSAASRIPDVMTVMLASANGTVLANLGQAAVLNTDVASMEGGRYMLLAKGVMPVAVDIVKGGAAVGRLVLTADISRVRNDFILTVIYTLAAALAAAMIGWLVSKPLQNHILTPVQGLTRQIAEIKRSRNYTANLTDASGIGEVRILRESFNALMSDIRHRDESLRRLAFVDTRTGLPNRAAFLDALTHGAAGLTGAVAIIDLRRFRSLNEAFGQATGDRLLVMAANKIEAAAQGNLVARVGGHEFAVHLPSASTREAAERAIQMIRLSFAAHIPIETRGIKVDVDAGIALAADLVLPAADAEHLMHCAALALNRARAGAVPGIAFFEEQLRTRAQLETELGQELRSALAENGLEVHYQAIMQVSTGKIAGYEALARWCHPKQGYVSPAVFIPVAEANGLIGELGRWVLNESVRQSSQWLRQTGRRRTVSVNVSAAQFLEAGFAEEVEACLKRFGLPPELLVLELTESVFVGASAPTIRENLQVLAGLGIKIALDDFGTGYSSLAYLARLPLTTIKIDRAFVAGADTVPRRRALLKSIVDMCHSVGMDVVAEGAETKAELAMIEALGAEKVQGYVIARPLPAVEAFVAAEAFEHAAKGLTAQPSRVA